MSLGFGGCHRHYRIDWRITSIAGSSADDGGGSIAGGAGRGGRTLDGPVDGVDHRGSHGSYCGGDDIGCCAVGGRHGHGGGDGLLVGYFAHQGEFFVGDESVAVFVGVSEHAFDFLVVDVLGQAHHDGSEL